MEVTSTTFRADSCGTHTGSWQQQVLWLLWGQREIIKHLKVKNYENPLGPLPKFLCIGYVLQKHGTKAENSQVNENMFIEALKKHSTL